MKNSSSTNYRQVRTPSQRSKLLLLLSDLFCPLWQISFLRWNKLISWEDFPQYLLTERPRGSKILLYCSRTRSSCLGFGPRNPGNKLDLFSLVRSEEIYLETCQGITCAAYTCAVLKKKKVFFIVVHTPTSPLAKVGSVLHSLAVEYCSGMIHLKLPEDKGNWLMEKRMLKCPSPRLTV